jgi:hypothetical protein
VAPPHRELDLPPALRRFDGDVAAGVARAHDEDALALEVLRPPVVAGVERLAADVTGILGDARIPKVAVGHDHGLVGGLAAVREPHGPPGERVRVAGAYLLDCKAERHDVREPEVVGVRA